VKTADLLRLISFTGQVLVAGYSFIAKVQRAPAEIRALMQETASLNILLDQLQSLVIDNDDVNSVNEKDEPIIYKTGGYALHTLETLGVFENCERLMRVVQQSVKACEQIQGQQVKNLGRKLIWPFKEKETKDTMQQLGRLRETLSAAVVVDSARS